MTAVEQPTVLLNILAVLERIEEKLDKLDKKDKKDKLDKQDKQDRLFEHLKELVVAAKDTRSVRSSNHSLDDFDNLVDSGRIHGYVGEPLELEPHDRALNRPPSKESLASNVSSGQSHTAIKVRYSDWSSNWFDWTENEDLMQVLQQRLGDYWNIPEDNRLPLTFSKSNIGSTQNDWGSQVAVYLPTNSSMTRLEELRLFDTELRTHPGNDFLVIDYDAINNTRIYRIGEAAIGKELMVDPGQLKNAPWSRLMYVSHATRSGTSLTNIQSIPGYDQR